MARDLSLSDLALERVMRDLPKTRHGCACGLKKGRCGDMAVASLSTCGPHLRISAMLMMFADKRNGRRCGLCCSTEELLCVGGGVVANKKMLETWSRRS